MLLKLQMYDFKLIYKPGKKQYVVDTLSRTFQQERQSRHDEREEEDYPFEEHLCRHNPFREVQEDIQRCNTARPTVASSPGACEEGMAECVKHCTSCNKPYWDVRTGISECDGLLFKSERLIVPTCMRSTILKDLHSAHQGTVKRVERERRRHCTGRGCKSK